jgi:hypothetical protein
MDDPRTRMNSRSENEAPEYRSDTPVENRKIVPASRARQGVTGHNVRYVLGFGLAGAILLLAVIYVVYVGPHLAG